MADDDRDNLLRRRDSARVSRRRLLALGGSLSLGALLAACSSGSKDEATTSGSDNLDEEPAATATPEPPFVVPAGEERRMLMAGTAQEAPLYVFGSGLPGRNLMVLGGVHGNEPGGWLAAERLLERMRPARGALLVAPECNRIAMSDFVRTTDALGDLNRLYPGDAEGLPMARMAAQIVALLREYRVSVLVDMHESWAFYKDRPQNGTAFLGQTVATNGEAGIALARATVEAVNSRILAGQEELFFREFPPGRLPSATSTAPFDRSGNPQAAVSGGSASSLGLNRHVPGLTTLLVEMGQQQTLERRIALHVDVAYEVGRRINLLDA